MLQTRGTAVPKRPIQGCGCVQHTVDGGGAWGGACARASWKGTGSGRSSGTPATARCFAGDLSSYRPAVRPGRFAQFFAPARRTNETRAKDGPDGEEGCATTDGHAFIQRVRRSRPNRPVGGALGDGHVALATALHLRISRRLLLETRLCRAWLPCS